jgi:SAM-dependent methyltransferase
LPVETRALDIEAGQPDLGEEAFDVVLVVHFLHRPLFPALRRALTPGGLLIYETFTREQAKLSQPSNPAFLLEPGELPALCAGLEIVRQREGQFEGRHAAAVAARRAQ